MTAVVAPAPAGPPLASWYIQLDGVPTGGPLRVAEDGLRTGYSFVVEFLVEKVSVRDIRRDPLVWVSGPRFLASGALSTKSTGSRSFRLHEVPDGLRDAVNELFRIVDEWWVSA